MEQKGVLSSSSDRQVGCRWLQAGVRAAVVSIHVAVVAVSVAGPLLILGGTFRSDGKWSIQAWANVFGSYQRWASLLENTGVACGAAVVVCVGVGTILATLIFKTNIRCRSVMIALLLLGAALPLYAVNGAVFSVLGSRDARGSPLMVGLIHAIAHLPIVVLIVGVSLRTVAGDLEEMASVDGAGPLRVLFAVTYRAAIGGFVACVILVVLWVSTDYSVSDMLLVRTFAEEVYTQYALYGQPQEPALVCLPQFILFGILLWGVRRWYLTGRDVPSPTIGIRLLSLGRLRWLMPLIILAGLTIHTIGPLLSLSARMLDGADPAGAAMSFAPEIKLSLVSSLVAGLLSAALGVGLAWWVVRRRSCWSIVVLYVILLLAIPAPVLGMGLIGLFNRPGLMGMLYDSPAMLVIAYVLRFLPISVILLIPAVRSIPVECELAARVDGCGPMRVWSQIVWPQCLSAALIVTFVVMVLSLGELPCSLLVSPPGCVTVGSRFFSLLHYGLFPDAATLCLLSIGCVILPWACLLLLIRGRFSDKWSLR